jgi:hypothetical protein
MLACEVLRAEVIHGAEGTISKRAVISMDCEHRIVQLRLVAALHKLAASMRLLAES